MPCTLIKLLSLLEDYMLNIMLLVGTSVLLSSCDAPLTETMAPESDHCQVTISTGRNLNGKLALKTDLIQVYDKQLFESLKLMDATLFREKRNQIISDNADNLAIWSYDFSEGQVDTFSFPTNRNYWGIIIYLHFIDNPQNRIVLTKAKDLRLQIEEGSFRITSNGKSGNYIRLEEGGNI